MSDPSHPLITPVCIAITSITSDPDLTVEGIDLESGQSVSVAIRTGATPEAFVFPKSSIGLVLVLSLQSVSGL